MPDTRNRDPKHLRSSDSDWETFGATDPYFAVLTDPKFHASVLTDEARAEFFASGARYVDELFDAIHLYLGVQPKPGRALDFGCGVGRLLIPLASRFAQVVGLDVSQSMLEEARKNCRDLPNVRALQSDDALSAVEGGFDFINSYIVLQHIPPERGERILDRLLELLNPGGIAAIHLTYDAQTSAFGMQLRRLRRFPILNALANLVRGRSLRAGHMQMNPYPLNRVLSRLQAKGYGNLHLIFTDHDGKRGVLMLFEKQATQAWAF